MCLAERYEAARRHSFVGRQRERKLFESILFEDELPFCILHIFGAVGVGKTTLLQEFIAMTHRAGINPIYVDGSHINQTAASFMEALQDAMELVPPNNPLDAMAASKKRYILFIDTYEKLAMLDDWLRLVFLPQLPTNIFVVLAGHQPPSLAWRTDLGWQSLLRTIPLGYLSEVESSTYLTKRHIPAAQQERVLDFAHGHPLALSLVAALFEQRPHLNFKPEEEPSLIRNLLSQFVQKVPSLAHRIALETSGIVRFTTEALLSIALPQKDVHELFEWLEKLSFIESNKEGIFPHNLVRETIRSDLQWRHQDRYTELHHRIRAYYIRRLKETSGKAQRSVLMDYHYLQRDHPNWKPFFDWQERETLRAENLQAEDIPALIAMVAKHEGRESAKLVTYWLTVICSCQMESSTEEQARGVVLVLHNSEAQPIGFMLLIFLHQLTEQALNSDPITKAAWAYLQTHAPLRASEKASLLRFWMAQESYQEVSAIQTNVFLNAAQHDLTTEGQAFSFFCCAKPDFWAPAFAYMGFNRLRQAEYNVDGQQVGIYGHDWRAIPPPRWLDMLAEHTPGINKPSKSTLAPLAVLDEKDFRDAVRHALRHYNKPDQLECNPLMHSRLVMGDSKGNNNKPITTLRHLLKETIDGLQPTRREVKYYRVLYHTYLQPAPTQEKAAELLNLPFSTYRRHLKRGIERITFLLWERELGQQG